MKKKNYKEKKGIIRRSRSVRHREINNLNKEIKPIKIEFNNKEDKNIPLKRSGLSTDKFDKNKKNDITQEREKEKEKGIEGKSRPNFRENRPYL